jgi:hypothetical protein
MTNDRFQASTQYDDLRGTVAADRADIGSVEAWLQGQCLVQEGESLVGVSLHASQLPASDEDFVQVSFLLAPTETNLNIRIPGEIEPPTIVVRRVERQMTSSEFFRFFKRLEITLSSHGEFEGRTFTHIG